MRRTVCKRGHPLTPENISGKQCRVCKYRGIREWKRRQREKNRKPPRTACPKGHPYPESRRPGRSDCAVCHREHMVALARSRGVPPLQRTTREKQLADRRRHEAKRKALKQAAFVEDVDPRVVFERDGGICRICGVFVDPDRYEIDHIVPLSRGGEHSYANTQLTHPRCNRRKWARTG